jgi:carbon monoxide dehydrogenase subunit G
MPLCQGRRAALLGSRLACHDIPHSFGQAAASMELKGEVRIPASRAKVWAALTDPAVLRAAIPGCTELERLSDTELTAVIAGKLGMVRATFNGMLTFADLKAPESMTVTAAALAGGLGSASGTADVVLAEVKGDTVLRYTVRGEVAGKLRQVGSRLVDSTARDVADRFFANFGEVVSENPIERVEHTIGHVAEEAIEVVEEAAAATVEAGRKAEETVEVAAVRGVWGGPMIWGLLVIVAIAAALMVFR